MEQAQVGGGGLGWAGSAGSATGGEAAIEMFFGNLIEVLATLSLVNVAELRGLPGTVFKTYLVPCAEPVAEAMAEAMAEAGRFYHEAAGAIKDRPEADRAEAHEQLGPPFVHVWVAQGWRRSTCRP